MSRPRQHLIPPRVALLSLLVCVLGSPLWGQDLQAPDSFDFGIVKSGTRARGQVELRHGGNNEALILVEAMGAGFAASPDTLRIPPAGSRVVQVDFSADAPGAHEGQLRLIVKKLFGTEELAVSLHAIAEPPRLEVVPPPAEGLVMGAVVIGQTLRQQVVLANRGRVDLVIDSLQLAGQDTPFRLESTDGLDLAPGEQASIDIEFSPSGGGDFTDGLIIYSAELVPARLALALRGQGLAPSLAVSPLPEVGVDFGMVEVGASHNRTITILNRGQAELRIVDIDVSGGGFSTPAAGDTATPVLPGGHRQIPVSFEPRYEGAATGSLSLRTDDPSQSRVELPLRGSAEVSPARVEIINNSTVTFGSVPVGKIAREQLLLWNRGGSPYTVRLGLAEESGDFDLATSALLLQPGESGKVELQFHPKEVGTRGVDLMVETEAGRAQYRLEGTGNYLKLSPAIWDFDRVPVGESSSAIIDLANVGNADFTINRITSTSDAFAVYTQVAPESEFLLPANSLRTLPVSVAFAPPARGLSTGTLRLEGFWQEGTETFEILLNGTGVAAEIELYPSGPIDFGHVVLGETQARTLVATNTGDTSLRVTTNPLTREAGIMPANFALEPGESTQLRVSFTPEALGDRLGQILLVSNDVRDQAQPITIRGKGALESIDLTGITRVMASRKSITLNQEVGWNNVPLVLRDGTKIDLGFMAPDSLRQALIGRRISVEWVELDENYDPKGGARQTEIQIYGDADSLVFAEDLNLRLQDTGPKRVRLRVTTRSYPEAPPLTISQVLEAGGWKWEFEAKPLISFLTIRPGRDYTDANGQRVKGKTERLIGLPGIAFAGWHNAENPSISGVHFTAIGNVLEALSTENALAVSVGIAASLYKDRFLLGFGYDIYDSRPKAKRKGTQDYIMTFKYSGLF